MSGPQSVFPPSPGPLTIDRRNDADGVTLVLRGEIDLASAPVLERALQDIERSSPDRIVLDLAALDFLDSSGIHLLIRAQERARTSRHQLVVTRVPVHAQRLFELTGIKAQLNIE
jgi:anti-anti-sigma factor